MRVFAKFLSHISILKNYFSEIQHFEIIIQEAEDGCAGPSISLATCSPLVPSPSATLSQDYIRFDLDNDS